MLLIINHRSGPLAGREQSVQVQADKVTFGRDAQACDVVFPPDETLVSRRHFSLVRRPSGAWTIDLFGDPYVELNGAPTELGKPVKSGDVITLGKPGGPSFQVYLGDKGLGSGLAPTALQARMKGSREVAAGARRLAAAGVAVAVAATLVAGGVWYFARVDSARLNQAVAGLAEEQQRAASQSIGAAVRDRLLEASYVVVRRSANGQESAVGTASPIASDLLATNAHIVELVDKLRRGERMLVRSPGANGRSFEVIAARKHPGYDAFQTFLDQDPFFVSSSDSWLKASLSYDVGTLRVAAGANLSPILEIESRENLDTLRPGTPLVMAGYPLERIAGSEVQAIGATPTLSVGIITALTDMFNLPTDPGYRRLVQHNLPGTGGNSGSPMLNGAGKIVALHNAGSYINVPNVGRVPNAALVRFAQRADLLLDLLDGKAEASLQEHRAYWAKQTAAFKRGVEVLVPYILSQRRPATGAKPSLVTQAKYALAQSDQFRDTDKEGKTTTRRQRIHPVTLKAGQSMTYIAYAQNRAKLRLYLLVDGKAVEEHDRNNWFPHLQYAPTKDGAGQLYVVSADEDVSYTLMEYGWDAPRS